MPCAYSAFLFPTKVAVFDYPCNLDLNKGAALS